MCVCNEFSTQTSMSEAQTSPFYMLLINYESLAFFRGFHLSQLGFDLLKCLRVKPSEKVLKFTISSTLNGATLYFKKECGVFGYKFIGYHIEKIIRDHIRSPSKVVTFPSIIINRHMSRKYTVYITNLVLDKVSCFNEHC